MTEKEFENYVYGITHSSYGINELWVPDRLKVQFDGWFKKEGTFFYKKNEITSVEYCCKSNLY